MSIFKTSIGHLKATRYYELWLRNSTSATHGLGVAYLPNKIGVTASSIYFNMFRPQDTMRFDSVSAPATLELGTYSPNKAHHPSVSTCLIFYSIEWSSDYQCCNHLDADHLDWVIQWSSLPVIRCNCMRARCARLKQSQEKRLIEFYHSFPSLYRYCLLWNWKGIEINISCNY